MKRRFVQESDVFDVRPLERHSAVHVMLQEDVVKYISGYSLHSIFTDKDHIAYLHIHFIYSCHKSAYECQYVTLYFRDLVFKFPEKYLFNFDIYLWKVPWFTTCTRWCISVPSTSSTWCHRRVQGETVLCSSSHSYSPHWPQSFAYSLSTVYFLTQTILQTALKWRSIYFYLLSRSLWQNTWEL